jgi:putative ABC transport system permease protein
MAIPLSYSLRSLKVRWNSTLVAVAGIAGTVAVFLALLSLAHGFKATVVASGSPDNAIVRRTGATVELDSSLTLDQVKAVEDVPVGVARSKDGAIASPEVVVFGDFPLKETGTDAHVQLRGVSANVLQVRSSVKIISGRFFKSGLNELIIGNNVARTYSTFDLGRTVRFGGAAWTVVGVFDAGGSAFDSEVWADSSALAQAFRRPQNVFQSLTVRLSSADDYNKFKDALTADPRLNVQVDRESDFYDKQSRELTRTLVIVGLVVGLLMAIGAVLSAVNTMYSTISERAREIAAMRAIGFGSGSVVLSFLFEAECIALVGGILGCLLVLPLNGFVTGAMNPQTASHLAFAFHVSPVVLLLGIAFALFMGLVGGVLPAARAARTRISVALREM